MQVKIGSCKQIPTYFHACKRLNLCHSDKEVNKLKKTLNLYFLD